VGGVPVGGGVAVEVGDGLGLGDGLGEGLGERVGLGVGEALGEWVLGGGVGARPVKPLRSYDGKSRTFMPCVAAVMNRFQMSAGSVPPNTSGNPSTFVMDFSRSG
jgi:hypothetical protein